MAFTTPGTATAGEVLTAAFWNTNVRDNTNYLYDTGGMWNLTPSSITAAGAGSSASINSDGSITATACTSLIINGVFSSTYGVYQLFNRLTASGTDAELRYQNSLSGTPATSAYNFIRTTADGSSVATAESNAQASESIGRLDSTGATLTFTTIMGPQLASTTQFFSNAQDTNSTVKMHWYCGNHTTATAYDGFALLASTGSFTGTIFVKGLR
jgi:hypothetical protein